MVCGGNGKLMSYLQNGFGPSGKDLTLPQSTLLPGSRDEAMRGRITAPTGTSTNNLICECTTEQHLHHGAKCCTAAEWKSLCEEGLDVRDHRESDNQRGFQGKGEVLREFLHTHPWALSHSVPQLCKGRQCISRLSVSLAALISAMNRQLFVFVQQNPGLFMTVYHEGNLAKGSLHLLGVTNKW